MNKFELEKINNYRVQLPKVGSGKGLKWKGKDLLEVQYWNFAIIGKKKSGKTSLIYTLIKNFCTKKTIVLFFVSTFNKDKSYDIIREYLEKKGIQFHGFTELKTDGVDNVQSFIEANKGDKEDESDEEKEDEKEVKINVGCNFGPSSAAAAKKEPPKKPKKKIDPDYLLVFDDLSEELRSKSITALCKKNRHFKCKIILSSQSVKDLMPATWAQVDYVALFRHLNEESIESVWKRLQPYMNSEQFWGLYNEVTNEPRKDGLNNFLIFDRDDETFRVNLDKKIKFS